MSFGLKSGMPYSSRIKFGIELLLPFGDGFSNSQNERKNHKDEGKRKNCQQDKEDNHVQIVRLMLGSDFGLLMGETNNECAFVMMCDVRPNDSVDL